MGELATLTTMKATLALISMAMMIMAMPTMAVTLLMAMLIEMLPMAILMADDED